MCLANSLEILTKIIVSTFFKTISMDVKFVCFVKMHKRTSKKLDKNKNTSIIIIMKFVLNEHNIMNRIKRTDIKRLFLIISKYPSRYNKKKYPIKPNQFMKLKDDVLYERKRTNQNQET